MLSTRKTATSSRAHMDQTENQLGISRRGFVKTSAAVLAAGAIAPYRATAQDSTVTTESRRKGQSRVILDTDTGVDDAFALLFAMSSPELKIEAITAVSGNVPLELTLPNAMRMVEIAGRTDIPVAAGAKVPLARRLVTAEYAHGNNGLGGAIFPEPKMKPAAQSAAELICKIVRKYPGEVTPVSY